MPSEVRLERLVTRLKRFNVTCKHTKGGHMKAKGQGVSYPFPLIRGRFVDSKYVTQIRRRFKLTSDDGVTDDAFWG